MWSPDRQHLLLCQLERDGGVWVGICGGERWNGDGSIRAQIQTPKGLLPED